MYSMRPTIMSDGFHLGSTASSIANKDNVDCTFVGWLVDYVVVSLVYIMYLLSFSWT